MGNYSEPLDVKTDYLHPVLRPPELRRLIKRAAYAVRCAADLHSADSIVVTGVSGMALGFSVSALTDLPILVVRKAGWKEASHSPHNVEGFRFAKRAIFLDDLIESGRTLRHVIHVLDQELSCAVVALVLYRAGSWNDSTVYRSIPVFSARDLDYKVDETYNVIPTPFLGP